MAEKPRFRVAAGSGIRPSAPSALTVQRARASYDGAARTDRTASWNGAPDISAHFALSLYGPELRRRSWIAYRNIAVARRGIERMTDALVGSGARPRLRGVPAADAQRWLRLWERWTRQADPTGATTFYGLQRQACLEMLIGGDAIARFRERRLTDGLVVPLQIEMLSADFLPDWKHELAPNGNVIRAGIELNPIGQPTAYHLYRSNPKDVFGAWSMNGQNGMTVPVPVSEVLHMRAVGAAGQLRGEPILAPALLKLRDLDDYDDAELVRMKSLAVAAGFIEDNGTGEPSTFEQLATPTETPGVGSVAVEPGLFVEVGPGKKIVPTPPAGVAPQYEAFVRTQLRLVAAAVGVPYEALFGDWSASNDRTYRAAMLEWKRYVDAVRWTAIEPQFLRPVWTRFVRVAVLSGAADLPAGMTEEEFVEAVEWAYPAWGWLNPVQEVEAYKAAIRSGLTTRAYVVGELGFNIEDIDAELAADQARADALGLALDTDPRRTSNAGVTQARPAGSTDPNAPSLAADSSMEPRTES
jgi:lambda family phage portal protein